MKYRLMKWLVCPHCRSENLQLEGTKIQRNELYTSHIYEEELDNEWDTEVVEGTIYCSDCYIF